MSIVSTPVSNIYQQKIDLFTRGEFFEFNEDITQGDLLAMVIYVVAAVPLIKQLSYEVTQIWYADEAALLNKIHQLREWWS